MSDTHVTVSDLIAACERLWPRRGAEEWDNTGLQVGRRSQNVSRVLLVVDVVEETVREAIEGGYDAIVSHHPLILRGIGSVSDETYKGRLIGDLLRNNIALLSMHTNADVVPNGVSDVLAQLLGLTDVLPIVPTATPDTGIGRVGNTDNPTTLGELATKLASVLPATVPGIQVSGEFTLPIRRIALCGGAGDSLLDEAHVLSSDVYITSDLRHHRASEARERAFGDGAPALINVSHWASEWLWLTPAREQLSIELPSLDLAVSDARTDPWDFVVTQ